MVRRCARHHLRRVMVEPPPRAGPYPPHGPARFSARARTQGPAPGPRGPRPDPGPMPRRPVRPGPAPGRPSGRRRCPAPARPTPCSLAPPRRPGEPAPPQPPPAAPPTAPFAPLPRGALTHGIETSPGAAHPHPTVAPHAPSPPASRGVHRCAVTASGMAEVVLGHKPSRSTPDPRVSDLSGRRGVARPGGPLHQPDRAVTARKTPRRAGPRPAPAQGGRGPAGSFPPSRPSIRSVAPRPHPRGYVLPW